MAQCFRILITARMRKRSRPPRCHNSPASGPNLITKGSKPCIHRADWANIKDRDKALWLYSVKGIAKKLPKTPLRFKPRRALRQGRSHRPTILLHFQSDLEQKRIRFGRP